MTDVISPPHVYLTKMASPFCHTIITSSYIAHKQTFLLANVQGAFKFDHFISKQLLCTYTLKDILETLCISCIQEKVSLNTCRSYILCNTIITYANRCWPGG